MFAFFSALALAATSSGAASHGSKDKPPTGSLEGAFKSDDYPAEALKRNEQGDVRVLVRVDRDGRIAQCVVEHSSGSAALDGKTCEVIRQRAKLEPARDRKGRAVAGDMRETIGWRIAPETPELSVKPKGSLQGLISGDDYPPEALDRDEQGDVGILLLIDETGTVTDCMVQKSSGSASLDRQTCLLIRQRAKFQPALDQAGKPIAVTYSQTIMWRTAETRPATSWATTIAMSFAEDGKLRDCTMIGEGAIIPADGKAIVRCTPSAAWRRMPKLSDYPLAATFLAEQRFEPIADAPPRPLKDGDDLVTRVVLDLKINAAGDVTSCNIAKQEGEPPAGDLCSEVRKYHFLRKGLNGEGAPFRATMIFTTFWRVQPLESVAIPSRLGPGR